MRTRTPRTKITKDNYNRFKEVADVLPKHKKGNDSVRAALNISAGTWHYLRKSKDYKEFAYLQKHHNDARVVVKKGEFTHIPEGDGQMTLAMEGAPAPRPASQLVPNLDARAICASIDKNTDAILKLVEAWQTKSVPAIVKDGVFEQPAKKGWLR